MSQNLCIHCQNLSGAWLVPRFYDLRDSKYPAHEEPILWWTYASWEELEESSKSCSLCALIVQESHSITQGPFTKGDRPGIRFQASGSSRLEVWCVEKLKRAKLNVALDSADIYRAPHHAHGLFDAHLVSQVAGDDRNISTIKHWLEVCKFSHPKCSKWASQGHKGRHLPTRVLDVGELNASKITLHSPSDTDASDYAALSYCWGRSGNPYCTDRSNVEKHITDGIALASLPITLQDAVELTRMLGVRYLWIDALCIVQNDREDWVHEASLMGIVYSQALFTISADASKDTSTGILLKRSSRHNTSVALPWPLDEPEDGLGPMSLHVIPDFKNFKEELAISPLAQRGWTFQERALSARIVHFGSELCYWECKEACIGENEEIGKYSIQDEFFHLKDMFLSFDSTIEIPTSKLHDKWAWVMSHFSSRQLTKGSDFFPALEGVASLFANKNKLGNYLCGLWEDEFLRHLLWLSDHSLSGSTRNRSTAFRAPSWSWAAIEGPVHNPAIKIPLQISRGCTIITEELGYDGLLSHEVLKIRQVRVETEGSTNLGPVIEAIIQATGIFHSIKVGLQFGKGVFGLELVDRRVVGIVIWDTDLVPDRSVPYWVCPVMQRKDSENGQVLFECLVIRASGVNYSGELTFERVGKGRMTNVWGEHPVLHDFTIV